MNGVLLRLHNWRDGLSGLKGWRRRLAAMVLGIVAALALPPLYGVVFLIPAISGLVWILDGADRPRRAFFDGWWFGFGFFAAGLYWVGFALLVDAERFGWLLPFAISGLAAGMAMFCGATTLLAHAGPRSGAPRVLFLAAAWVLFEWVRSWFLTGFPWNLMGSVWVFSDSMIQVTSLAGTYGLSLLTVAAAGMPAVLGEREGRRGMLRVGAMALVLVAVWVGGMVRLQGAGDGRVAGVHLRLVQPNIAQADKWKPELRQKNLLKQMQMSKELAPGATPPTHVIWAETAAPFYLANDARRRMMIGAITPVGGLTITGAPRTTAVREDTFRVWNSIHAIDGGGRINGTYDKSHLVPFGEYVPFPRIFNFAKITEGSTGFSAGAGPVTLRLRGLPPVSPLICYEVIFPGQVIDPTDRPQWMLNLTNDGWYGRTPGPHQHFATARLRAVEEGLPVVRVANTGISGVIDAYGRVVASLGLGRDGVLDSDLPKPIATTFYGRLGNAVVLLWVLMVGGAAVLSGETRGVLRRI